MGKMHSEYIQVLDLCLHLKKNERLLVIADRESSRLGQGFLDTACKISPSADHRILILEDFGQRLPNNPLAFGRDIAAAVAAADATLYIAGNKPGELSSLRKPLLEQISASGHIRHGHMPGLTKDLLKRGFAGDYKQVIKITHKLYDALVGSKKAHVYTPLGSDFHVQFDPSYRWVASDAIIKAGAYGNIPSGEVFTCVGDCHGRLVIDGELGDYLCARYGVLHDTPVTLDIVKSRVSRIDCDNPSIVKDLQAYFQIDENANRVGEFAIGTNINLKEFIGNLLLDEKFPGVHVAFGSGYPDKTGADWNGKAHLDCIITKPTVTIDNKTVMRAGEFSSELLA
jgi:aminopeptidase